MIGRTADYRLVSAVAQIPEPELTEGLRDAVAHQVLIAEPDALAYRFRHALVYETVYDDLLPSERVQLHARIAELLGERPDWFDGDEQSLASELACHWDAAHDQRRALPAALAAARCGGPDVRLPRGALPRRTGVDAVGTRRRRGGADRSELRGHAAVHRGARRQLRQYRARRSCRRAAALDAVDEETDPIEAALVHERIGRYMYYENYAPDDLLEHNRKAVRLVPEVPPSVERAQVLATLGQQLMVVGRNPEAIETCEVCIEVARAVGARVIEGHAHNTLGSALSGLGHLEAGQAELAIACDIASRPSRGATSPVPPRTRRERAGIQPARRGGGDRARRCRTGSAPRPRPRCGAFLRINAGVSLYELGRWDEMEEQLREADAIEAAGVDELRSAHAWATLFAGRGQFDAAEAQIQRGRSLLRGSTNAEVLLEFAMVEARVRAWSGDRAAAFLLAEHAFEERVFASSCSDAGPALLAVAAAVSEDDTAIAAVVATLDRWVAESRWGGGEPGDVRLIGAQIAAELHRTDPDVWRAVADVRGRRAPASRTRTYAALPRGGCTRRRGRPPRRRGDARAMHTRWRPPLVSFRSRSASKRSRGRRTSTSELRWRPPRRPSAWASPSANVRCWHW